MRVRAILIAAAVAVLAFGAGAVLVAASGDDGPSPSPFSSSEKASVGREPAPEPAPAPEASEPTTPTTETPPEATTPEQQAPTTDEPPPQEASPPEAPPQDSGSTRKTHFEREPKGAERNPAPDRQFEVPPAREFSGDGNARLGTVDVKVASILKWHTKGHFEVRFGREAVPIIAPSNTGQLVMPPFRFEEVRVVAAGRWRITISPQ